MATNDFLTFALGPDANVISQADYVADPEQDAGFAAGIAYAEKCNKVWRQSSFVTSAVSQFILEELDEDVEDDGNRATYVTQFRQAIQSAAATGGGGFPDAPANGFAYGRLNNAWHRTVNVSGDAMTGSLIFGNGITVGPPDNSGTGERVRLYSATGGAPNHALGIAGGGEFWSGIPAAGNHFAWYAGTNLIARMPGNGIPVLGTDLITLGYLQTTRPRVVLTANQTYYVSDTAGSGFSGGNDSWDGSQALHPTSPSGNTIGPWKTLQKACDWISANLDLHGFRVTVQMMPGTYNAGGTLANPVPGTNELGTQFVVQGTVGVPTDVEIHIPATPGGDCFVTQGGASASIQHMTLSTAATTDSGGYALAAVFGGYLRFNDIIFGRAYAAHLYASASGSIQCIGNYKVSGNSIYHAAATAGGTIVLSQQIGPVYDINFLNPVSFSSAFVTASAGYVIAPRNSFSGSPVTGVKFIANLFGVIDTEGKGFGYFPGDDYGNPDPNNLNDAMKKQVQIANLGHLITVAGVDTHNVQDLPYQAGYPSPAGGIYN